MDREEKDDLEAVFKGIMATSLNNDRYRNELGVDCLRNAAGCDEVAGRLDKMIKTMKESVH